MENINQKKTGLRDEHFQTAAFLAKSLSDENRLRILICISKEKKSVGSIVETLRLSQPLVSHHLKELARAGLIKMTRRGQTTECQVDPEMVKAVAEFFQKPACCV